MKGESFHVPPCDRKAAHNRTDDLPGIVVRGGRQAGISRRCCNTVVAEDFLDFEEIDSGFDQVGGIAVAQTVGSNLFFIPQSAATLRKDA